MHVSTVQDINENSECRGHDLHNPEGLLDRPQQIPTLNALCRGTKKIKRQKENAQVNHNGFLIWRRERLQTFHGLLRSLVLR